MAITTPYADTATIDGTEWSLVTNTAGPDATATSGIYQPYLDANAVVAADEFTLRGYEKVLSGGTQRTFMTQLVSLSANPNWVAPQLMLLHGFDYTHQKAAGTNRSTSWKVKRTGNCEQVWGVTRTNTSTRWSITADADASSSPAAQTTAGLYQVLIDRNAMAVDDIVEFLVWEKASSTQRIVDRAYIMKGADPLWFSKAYALDAGFDFTTKLIAGASVSLVSSVRRAA